MKRFGIAGLIGLLFGLLGGAFSFGAGNDRARTDDDHKGRPNIVVFLSDDQGWGDFSLTGNTDLETPNIDSLARDGAFFKNFYVCPVCSPTRAEFLTGRYFPRCGVSGTGAGLERLDLDETTLVDELKSAGYRTAAFGKWHNGMQAPYHPNSRGFDHFYGFCSGHWGNYFSPMLEENGEITTGEGFIVDDCTTRAIKFIQDNQANPFFVYLPYNTPHSPMQVPQKYWDRFKDKTLVLPSRNAKKHNLLHNRAALAMCENIDWNVGRVLQKLTQLGLERNTIVLYFTDNGPNGNRWNDGLKGRKGSTDEGGVRTPLVMRWPEKIVPGSFVNPVGGTIDLLPTLLEMAGVERTVGNKELDGVSMAKLVYGEIEESDWAQRNYFSCWGNRVSVRNERYRLDHQGNLFDLLNDRGQTTQVNKKHPEMAAELYKAVDHWKASVLSELEESRERPFVICHPDLGLTQLPARDAKVTGELKRSNRYPNCSYFTNWKNAGETIRFTVDVAESGEFDATVYYCCSETDVGMELELACGETKIRRTVEVANDSPSKGAEHDRFARAESYVKDFKPLSVGKIELTKGPAELVLSSPVIPGEQSIEFRLLTLRRLTKSK